MGILGAPRTEGGVHGLITLCDTGPVRLPIGHLLMPLKCQPLLLLRLTLSLQGEVFSLVAMEPIAEAHTWRPSFLHLKARGELVSPHAQRGPEDPPDTVNQVIEGPMI